VIKSLPLPRARNNFGYAKNASDPEGCAANAQWYWLCWFVRLVDPTAPRPHGLALDGSDSRHMVRAILDRFGAIVERAATLQLGAVRALRRLKLFRMFREDHRHVPSATSRPRVGPFRNGDALSASKDRLTPRSSRVEIGRPNRAAEEAALRDALELVGGDPRGGSSVPSGELPDAVAEAPRRRARASFGLRGSCLTNHTLSELRDCGGEACA
jgi:hypothetical protein